MDMMILPSVRIGIVLTLILTMTIAVVEMVLTTGILTLKRPRPIVHPHGFRILQEIPMGGDKIQVLRQRRHRMGISIPLVTVGVCVAVETFMMVGFRLVAVMIVLCQLPVRTLQPHENIRLIMGTGPRQGHHQLHPIMARPIAVILLILQVVLVRHLHERVLTLLFIIMRHHVKPCHLSARVGPWC